MLLLFLTLVDEAIAQSLKMKYHLGAHLLPGVKVAVSNVFHIKASNMIFFISFNVRHIISLYVSGYACTSKLLLCQKYPGTMECMPWGCKLRLLYCMDLLCREL